VIAFLTGRVAVKSATFLLLDVGGVGYHLNMTTSSLAALPAEGDEVTVHTHLHLREDDVSLYGFESLAEKEAFEHLLGVSGVGPKVALATLSVLSADSLAQAVAAQDVALISSVPGVGKKTAQRIILDLADKLGVGEGRVDSGTPSASGAVAAQARAALLGMGFSASEVASAMKGLPSSADAQTLLKGALKHLGGGA